MGEMKEIEKKNKYVPVLRQCFVTGGVAVNLVAQGCVIGYSAILIPNLRSADSLIHPTKDQESWIASVIGFALIVGNFIVLFLMDSIGRKKSHLLAILPILVGWFLFFFVTNVAGLITARFLQGVSMGMMGPLASIIIGESTDPKSRGMYLTSVSLSLTIGVLFAHAVGSICGWQVTALICSFITFTSFLMVLYAPETPPWLISKGRYEKSKEVFIWLRGEGHDDELENMIAAQKQIRTSITPQNMTVKSKIKRSFRHLNATYKKPEFYKPVVIMLLMYTMFQFAGINVLSSYTKDIIEEVVGPEANTTVLMVALDVERLICNVLAVFLMKILKRRTLLFSSGAVCVISYIGKAAYVYCKTSNILPFDSQWIPISLIGIYMFSLTVGINSIPFALSGEIFPLEYRALGSSVSVLALSFNFFVAVKSFPVLTLAIGYPLAYLLYAGVVVACMSVIWFMLPETKDRTLQDIEDSFRGWKRDDMMSSAPLNGGIYDPSMRRCSSAVMF